MRLFDTHAHLTDESFERDREDIIRSFPGYILAPGCNVKDSEAASSLAARYKNVFAAAGVHPEDCENPGPGYLDAIASLVSRRALAIGEIGLDYHYGRENEQAQKQVFETQLGLARDLSIPVIIHMRDATEDVMALIKKYRPRGVMHCFSGSAETAAECVRLGLYISFSGSVTFKNAAKLARAAKSVPEDRLLVETDSPYLAPQPVRGKRNEPSFVSHTLGALALLRNADPAELTRRTLENGLALFNITEVNHGHNSL